MIDDMEKTAALIGKMHAALPMAAEYSTEAYEALWEMSPDTMSTRQCRIISVLYAGDEGGILCKLDFEGSNTVYFVSLTHLTFDRRAPVSREIRTYKKHRIKRLRKHSDGQF